MDVLRDALAMSADATDEASLAEQAGHVVQLVEGDPRNLKITTPDDLALAERLLGASSAAPAMRIGNGYDLHRLVDGRPLILGGVTIPFEKGLLGHSDADVICHAITDAILGAAGAGDIGRHFPDTDPAWKDAEQPRPAASCRGDRRRCRLCGDQRRRRGHRAAAEAGSACRGHSRTRGRRDWVAIRRRSA